MPNRQVRSFHTRATRSGRFDREVGPPKIKRNDIEQKTKTQLKRQAQKEREKKALAEFRQSLHYPQAWDCQACGTQQPEMGENIPMRCIKCGYGGFDRVNKETMTLAPSSGNVLVEAEI